VGVGGDSELLIKLLLVGPQNNAPKNARSPRIPKTNNFRVSWAWAHVLDLHFEAAWMHAALAASVSHPFESLSLQLSQNTKTTNNRTICIFIFVSISLSLSLSLSLHIHIYIYIYLMAAATAADPYTQDQPLLDRASARQASARPASARPASDRPAP
jgi:hypothetical protein